LDLPPPRMPVTHQDELPFFLGSGIPKKKLHLPLLVGGGLDPMDIYLHF